MRTTMLPLLIIIVFLPTWSFAQQPAPRSVAVERERARGDLAIERLSKQSEEELRRQFEAGKSEQRLAFRRFDVELSSAYRRVMQQGGDKDRAGVERALRAALGDLVDRAPSDLAARITEKGSADAVNLEMRDATLYLAMLARVTGDPRHAARAAALLARFAEVIPRWPIWNPYYEVAAKKKAVRQDDPTAFRSEFAAGLWGGWIYMDLIMGAPLVEAMSILEPTGAVDRTGAKAAVRQMFDLHLATQRKFNKDPDYSNMDGFQIRGYLDFGRLLPDPALVHEGVRRLRNLYRTSFLPDGWWHECAVSYHQDLQNVLSGITDSMLIGYSDPPGFTDPVDGTRFDDLDLAAMLRGPSARADLVTRRLVMPDGTLYAAHETAWPTKAPSGVQAPTRPFLFGAMGQGTLISGIGDGLAMATLHWGPKATHAHDDALNLNLWAKGTEAISETQYHPIDGSNSTREWHASTAGHATVVVDGLNQSYLGKRTIRRRAARPEDAIPGVADWRWRWTNCDAQDGGDLRLFATTFPEVQVVEADATRAYDSVTGVTMYRRTIALVRIDDADSYVVDVFRVKGGTSCDFMLHGSLQLEQKLLVSVPLQPTTGTAHRALRNLRSGVTDGPWLAAFEMENNVSLLTFMAPAPGTTVIQADGPAMRRVGDAPFVIARRSGPDTTFIAVHHVMRGSTPRVQGIELIPTECKDCVAFKVKVGARTDTVISCADRTTLCSLPGGIQMRGLFAHSATGPTPQDQWALLVDGDLLKTPDATIEGETAVSGIVRGTLRIEAGDEVNGFIVDEPLAEGGALAGSTIIVDQAGEMSWAYEVGKVSRRGGKTVIETPDEPGLIVKPGSIKQTYFPGWGFKGDARYRIPGQAVARPGGAADHP